MRSNVRNELQELLKQPDLSTQRPLDEKEWEKARYIAWATGWRVGYYAKPDEPIKCPWSDEILRAEFNLGICKGADAKELIEPTQLDSERAA